MKPASWAAPHGGGPRPGTIRLKGSPMIAPLPPRSRAAALLACAVLAWTAANAEEQAFLRDGDRVALVGDALCERDFEQGWLETALTAGNAGLRLRFRNFGWSGDTVACGARTNGLAGLQADLARLAPTVVVLGF